MYHLPLMRTALNMLPIDSAPSGVNLAFLKEALSPVIVAPVTLNEPRMDRSWEPRLLPIEDSHAERAASLVSNDMPFAERTLQADFRSPLTMEVTTDFSAASGVDWSIATLDPLSLVGASEVGAAEVVGSSEVVGVSEVGVDASEEVNTGVEETVGTGELSLQPVMPTATAAVIPSAIRRFMWVNFLYWLRFDRRSTGRLLDRILEDVRRARACV